MLILSRVGAPVIQRPFSLARCRRQMKHRCTLRSGRGLAVFSGDRPASTSWKDRLSAGAPLLTAPVMLLAQNLPERLLQGPHVHLQHMKDTYNIPATSVMIRRKITVCGSSSSSIQQRGGILVAKLHMHPSINVPGHNSSASVAQLVTYSALQMSCKISLSLGSSVVNQVAVCRVDPYSAVQYG